jgi:hypothetical protein
VGDLVKRTVTITLEGPGADDWADDLTDEVAS